jgi:hypothetical protein
MMRLENFRWPSKGKSLEVAKLPSLRPSYEGITIVYPFIDKPNGFHMFQPFQFVGNAWSKRGMVITTQKQRGNIWTKAHHHGASYVGR